MDKITDPADPRGLIRESYRIDGITLEECRSIFLDWAISVPSDEDSTVRVQALFDTYGPDAPSHPMTSVLQDALSQPARTGRRGGARGRRTGDQTD